MTALPNVSHLRRAADAVAGRDDQADHWVLIELSDAPPYNVEVFNQGDEASSKAAELNAGDTGTPWAVIACRSEAPEVRDQTTQKDAFFMIIHGEWSPMALAVDTEIDRKKIVGYELTVVVEAEGGGVTRVPVEVPKVDIRGKALGRPDAFFLSFEALDKYLFPNLSGVYGVHGANKLRADLIDYLKDRFGNYQVTIT